MSNLRPPDLDEADRAEHARLRELAIAVVD
jgi:hypothetical protein